MLHFKAVAYQQLEPRPEDFSIQGVLSMYLFYETSASHCAGVSIYKDQRRSSPPPNFWTRLRRLELCRSWARRDGYTTVVLPHVMKSDRNAGS